MVFIKPLMLAVITSLFALNSLAAALDINGIRVEDATDVHGTRILLNGAGTHYKGPFKVYVAGLYLGKKVTTPAEVVNQPGPKRLSITMVRDIDAAELGKLLTRGMEDNMGKSAMSQLIPV